MSQFTKQKQKKPAKKEYLTDLRIRGATPEQVATSLFRNDKKLAEKKEKGVMGVSPLLYIFPLNYYQIRNQVAHGNLRAERIDVSETIEEFFHIQSSLARD